MVERHHIMTRSRRVAIAAIAVLLSACATTQLAPEDSADLDARQGLDASLGAPIHLLEQAPVHLAGLVSQDGRAHVFAVDDAKALRHIEMEGQTVVTRERVGTLEDDLRKIALDVIEWPPGTLRVAAGSSQFIRAGASPAWQEVKGNRCRRFVTVGDRLYCTFVMSGEEINSPTRTDWYVGMIVLIPFAIPVERQSHKLVMAEATGEKWVVRAVLDADDPLDTALGVIGADNEGNVHLLYSVSRGGALILFAGRGIAESPQPRLRYARVRGAALLSTIGGTPQTPSKPYLPVKGSEVPRPPWIGEPYLGWDFRAWRPISLLRNRFAVNPASSEIEGLARAVSDLVRLHGKWLKFDGVLGVGIRDGKWQEQASVVLTGDWPENGLDYGFISVVLDPQVRFDANGALHALVPHCTNHPVWQACKPGLSYLVKRGREWSRPLTFTTGIYSGQLAVEHAQAYTHLMVDKARVYVAWVEKDAGLLGRWILPREATAR